MKGSVVSYVDQDILFYFRARLFTRYFKLDDRISLIQKRFNSGYVRKSKKYNLALALGLIYHFNDVLGGLHDLISVSDHLIIETISGDVTWDSIEDGIYHKDGEPVDVEKIVQFFLDNGYSYEECDDWRNYANRFNKSVGRRLFYFYKGPKL